MQENNQNTDYELLITKYLSGESSDLETEQLIRWLEKNPANRKVLREYQKTWDHTNFTHVQSKLDIEKEWQLFIKKRNDQGTHYSLKKNRFNPMLRIAAVLIAGVLIASTILYFYNRPVQYATANTVKSIELDDGSTVLLNKYSTLVVHPFKNKNNRELKLQGEAYFDVQPDRQKPFVVSTNNLEIIVVGTSFNVNEYPGNNYSNVVVSSGKVAVNHKSLNVELLAGDMARLHKNEGELIKQVNSDTNYLSWKTHIFEFNNDSLKKVVETLNRVYDKKIIITNKSLNDCTITARFEKQSVQSIVEVLSSLLNVEVKQTEKTIEISGEGC
ncbi:MAG: DUF4974 domain-containing protein [Bacteroidetes bacterium]|jgi:ferric-dicitrate binding protein FerR (iron transport regulator)|nr:DUF4974 domain-containing protein [Bacteroidota bacterium]